jgi:N-acetylmuramoyl-L-alanine amidase
MTTADDMVKLAMQHVGEKYVLGADVPLDNGKYHGPWDCAEFASWLVYQMTGQLIGCVKDDVPVGKAEPYSDSWARDGEKAGHVMSPQEAGKLRGAVLVRRPRNDKPGHVSISRGDGTTIEAMDHVHGVAVGKIDGRRWDVCFRVPGIKY